MIICNLENILKERSLKISKVSADTKISRTTLTALCNNTGKGIQFETLNTLCIYLNIKPSQLLTAIPFDFAVGEVSWTGGTDANFDLFTIEILYSDRTRNECVYLSGGVSFLDYDSIADVRIDALSANPEQEHGNTADEVELFLSAIRSLPFPALQDIKQQIGAAVASAVKIGNEHSKPFVTFPEQFSALGAFR